MNEQINELRAEELIRILKHLNTLEPGTDEYTSAMENYETLSKQNIEEYKAVCDYSERIERREMEDRHHQLDGELKEKQIEYENEAREREEESKKKMAFRQDIIKYIGYGVEFGLILTPLLFKHTWTKMGFRHEHGDSISSKTLDRLFLR